MQGTAERQALRKHIEWEVNERRVSLWYRNTPREAEHYLDSVGGARYGPRWPAWYSEHRRLKDSLLQSRDRPRQ